jgi:hypothetical protein
MQRKLPHNRSTDFELIIAGAFAMPMKGSDNRWFYGMKTGKSFMKYATADMAGK